LQQTSTNSNGNGNSNSNKYPIAQPIAARVVPIAPSAFVPTQPAHPSQFTQNAMFQQPTQGSGVPSQSQSQHLIQNKYILQYELILLDL